MPVTEQESAAITSQATQLPPLLPQAPTEGEMQAPPAQHPLGQDRALHRQTPPVQVVPVPHAGPVPQRQLPVVPSQRSAVAELQLVQACPPVPQVDRAGCRQLPFKQHPLGQDGALHMQLPLTHAVPTSQAGFPPQRHSPVMEQLSARAVSQVTHAAPPAPQAAAEPLLQVEPEQQPPEQVVAVQSSQTPPVQARPPQSWQLAPPLPQLAAWVPGRQVLPEQQPAEHERLSQVQVPPTQCCPAAHPGPVPHWQLPAEHRSESTPQLTHAVPANPHLDREAVMHLFAAQQPAGHDMSSHWQAPARQRWPAEQGGPAPQAQSPESAQLSAMVASQTAQLAPAAPQWAGERVTQAPASQQPFGHDTASQAHFPPTHLCPTAQLAPVPQEQAPVAEQPSALVLSQPTHTTPPRPQALTDGALQLAPEQHPFGQVVLLQPLQRPAVQV